MGGGKPKRHLIPSEFSANSATPSVGDNACHTGCIVTWYYMNARRKPSRTSADREGRILRRRNAFLALVRRFPGISRQECARLLGVSTFSVSRLARQLIDENIVQESDPEPTPGAGQGRPSLPLRLNGDHEFYAGVDLEALHWRFVVIDFAGNPVHRVEHAFHRCANSAAYAELLSHLLSEEVRKCGALWTRVRALGVAAPGRLDSTSRTITEYATLPGFRNIPILDLHHSASGKPVTVLNNVACLAVHDLWHHAPPDSSERIDLHAAVRSGIGCVLTYRGRILSGSHNHAGHLGSFPVPGPDGLTVPLETLAGISALRARLPDAPDGLWRGETKAVRQAMENSDFGVVLSTAMQALARTLAGTAAILDPGEIVLHSPLFREENELWKMLVELYECSQQSDAGRETTLCRSQTAEFGPAIGAGLHALEQHYPTRQSTA
ncbi:MAG: ROK family transcriptional regulator [Lentisphaeria bacterium]|nr:ROK family transcriptional regulator [Lentisphaeria bacterium]